MLRKLKVGTLYLSFQQSEVDAILKSAALWDKLMTVEAITGGHWDSISNYFEIFANFPKLEKLCLPRNIILDEHLHVMLGYCPRLRHLDLLGPDLSTSDCALVKHCRELTSLKLTVCSIGGSVLDEFAQNNPNLL